jgi:sensor histidine kinase YesM
MATNPVIPPIKPTASREQINDIGIRALLIPFFGIAIPLITGMVPHKEFTLLQIKLSYLYTILLAFVIYQGTRYLHFTLRTYFDWLNKPVQKVIALLLTIPFYTIPVSVLMLVGWYNLFMGGVINWVVIKTTSLIILIAVFFLVHVYETVFLVKQTENDQLKKEQLERSRAEAELEALKNQIDPHFIFNSLNTLSYLIEDKPVRARQFNDNLADVYRYILQNKKRDLVLLREEVVFLQDYFSLLKIRFENAVQLNMKIDEQELDQYLVPPISLQILMENAIKHNEFSDKTPLIMTLGWKEGELIFHNDVRRKSLRKPSSKIGLQNLNERYRLITKQEITIREEDNKFTVCLPILKIT